MQVSTETTPKPEPQIFLETPASPQNKSRKLCERSCASPEELCGTSSLKEWLQSSLVSTGNFRAFPHEPGDDWVPTLTLGTMRKFVRIFGRSCKIVAPYLRISTGTFANSVCNLAILTYLFKDESALQRPLCFTSRVVLLLVKKSWVAPPCRRV